MLNEVNPEDPFDGISLGELQYATLFIKRYTAFLENQREKSTDEKDIKKYTFLIKFMTMLSEKNDRDIDNLGRLWHEDQTGEKKYLTDDSGADV